MSITLSALGRAHRSRGGSLQEWLIGKAPIHFGEKPLSMVWLDLANAIPERRLDPSGFVITCSPAARAASAMIRVRLATRPGSEVPPPRQSAQEKYRIDLPALTAAARVAAGASWPAAPLAVRGCMSVLNVPLFWGSTGGATAGAKR